MRVLQAFVLVSVMTLSISANSIGCDYTMSTLSATGDRFFFCRSSNVYVTSRGQYINQFYNSSSWQDFYSRNTETLLYFNSQTVNYVPRGISSYLANLKALQITSCNLKSLIHSDISGLTKLRILIMDSNDLETLANDVFVFNTALKYISFSNNKLKHIDSDILKHLDYLTSADFSGNTCVSSSLRSGRSTLQALFKENCPTLEILHEREKQRLATEAANQKAELERSKNARTSNEIERLKSELKKIKLLLQESEVKVGLLTSVNEELKAKNDKLMAESTEGNVEVQRLKSDAIFKDQQLKSCHENMANIF